ncbi:universal stress protein UspA [Mycolicibacterium agri]|uniref:Universal stress protein n=1 Tax=Mycolicibacterium agri TaxID=36811 RepID=A0A2A7MRN2_MYCAG|nr:universal stress protein [Mycolicibacterium agri]PEG33788.1 universal stress protein UspA [Mycolicibacterium agri]GFG50343.1 universal stress protein [Mycolicibacterium agri]
MSTARRAPAVVVGIDGSRWAVDAALWAVDEAVSRDVPLRLVYAIDPDTVTRSAYGTAAHDLAVAENAIRDAFVAVESMSEPVKIEVEIRREAPISALRAAAKSAALLCVGARGLMSDRVGPTATALAASARCPVALVLRVRRPGRPGCVVAAVDEASTDDRVLRRALEEAQLRRAPLRVVTMWHARYTDIHDDRAAAEGNRLARARLQRRLTEWKTRYPGVDVEAVAVQGNPLNYLAANAEAVQLLVVARDCVHSAMEVLGRPSRGAIAGNKCSVLICPSQNVS